MLNLTRVADVAGQMRASPLSYYRQKELAARAKRMRILWNVSQLHGKVTHEEIEAVLKGARLVDRRNQREKPSRVRRSSRMRSRTAPNWKLYSSRERTKLLERLGIRCSGASFGTRSTAPRSTPAR